MPHYDAIAGGNHLQISLKAIFLSVHIQPSQTFFKIIFLTFITFSAF